MMPAEQTANVKELMKLKQMYYLPYSSNVF